MKVIDIHTHILPKSWPDLAQKFGDSRFVNLQLTDNGADMICDGNCFRKIKKNCFDLSARLAEMDEQQVDMQVLSTVPIMFSYWAKAEQTLELCKILNDHLADCIAQYPDRFLGLATLPMQDTRLAIQELERCAKDLNLSGIEIGSHVNDCNLNHANLFPIFEACAALGMNVFVHPWDMMGKQNMPDYWLPWLVGMPAETSLAICSLIFGGVLERLPSLKIAFAHGGGSFPATLGRIKHGHAVRPDLCAVDNAHAPDKYLSQLYFDSLVHDHHSLQLLFDKFGHQQIMLGTDYPFPLGEHIAGELLRTADLSPEQLTQCLGGNAQRWLNMA